MTEVLITIFAEFQYFQENGNSGNLEILEICESENCAKN